MNAREKGSLVRAVFLPTAGENCAAWCREGCPPAEGPHLGYEPSPLPDYTMASFRCLIDPATRRCFMCGGTVKDSERGVCG